MWTDVRTAIISDASAISDRGQGLLVAADSRLSLKYLPDASISCVITSPPYSNLKDYGSENQLGFGQSHDQEYLPDIESVFKELWRICKEGAALWLILDSFKASGETVLLPWELAAVARKVGWTLHDLIVWDKGKSLPWSHPGRFRSVCEHILLLGKGRLADFNIDAVRDGEHLSSYWVRYPERYNPGGKAPSDLWHFPIPTQGSWSNGQPHHSCPFPPALVNRMVLVSTKPGDIVLDPFAGTGVVPAVATCLDRHGVGIELNPRYVLDFDLRGYDHIVANWSTQLSSFNGDRSLADDIVDLRIMKYSKTLFGEMARPDRLGDTALKNIALILVSNISKSTFSDALDEQRLASTSISLLLTEGNDGYDLQTYATQRTQLPPLSKYGLKVEVKTVDFDTWHSQTCPIPCEDSFYAYRDGRFYRYHEKIANCDLLAHLMSESARTHNRIPPIYAPIGLNLIPPTPH